MLKLAFHSIAQSVKCILYSLSMLFLYQVPIWVRMRLLLLQLESLDIQLCVELYDMRIVLISFCSLSLRLGASEAFFVVQ